MMNTNEQPTISKLDDNTVYRASVHFYSKGGDENVTLAVDVSHLLADEIEGNKIPASYAQVFELVMGIRKHAMQIDANDAEMEFLQDEALTPEEKAAMLLGIVETKAEVVADSILA